MQKLASRSKSPLILQHESSAKLHKARNPFDPDYIYERTQTLNQAGLQETKKVSIEERHRRREEEKAALELTTQIKRDEERAAAKMRWMKKTAKLRNSLPERGYYSQLPIKPGFFFLQSLMHAPKGQLKSLRVNIPETLYHCGHLWYIKTNDSGEITCDDSVSCVDFLKLRESDKCQVPQNAFDYIAAILRRRGDSENSMIKHILDWPQFRNKMLMRDIVEGCMIQKFIRSVGDKASVIRLQYHPHTRNNKANIAYFISNTKSERPEEFYKCVVNEEAVDSFEIFKLQGSAIRELERHAWGIVDYLGRGYGVRIEEIHLDFLKDEQGVLWLCGCRGFRLDPISISRSLSPISHPPEAHEILLQEADDRKNGRFVRCKLCRLHYQNQELPHLISVRMLFMYKMHATKRVDLPLNTDHLRLVTADLLSQSTRICELCFMLITSEFQLIAAEKRLAEALNIMLNDEELEENQAHIMQLQFLPKKMIQWRVLLYFRVADNASSLQGRTDEKLTVELFDYRNEFDVKIEGNEVIVNKLKMYYFFSSPDKPIRKFLNETKMKVVLHTGSDHLASGESQLLYHFPSTLPMGMALTQSRIMSLFPSAHSAPMDLSMTIGLSCDRYYLSKYLKVDLTKVNDVYLPEAHYFNGTPLPEDWMEQFGSHQIDSSFKAEIAPEDFYESTISREELRRMRNVTSEARSSSRSLSKSRSRTPGLPPLSYRASVLQSQRLPTVPSLDFSALAGSNNDLTVKDLLFSVNGFLHDRPKSALSASVQDHSISKTAQTVRLETAPKPTRTHCSKRKRRGSKEPSALSTRLELSSPSLRSFHEKYKEIHKAVGEDLKAYGSEIRERLVTMPPRSWTESYGDSSEGSCESPS